METYEEYKSYYEDASREQILEDTYIDYQAYKNLTREYSKQKIVLDEIKQRLQLALKCKDNELQCIFEAYEVEDMIKNIDKLKVVYKSKGE